MTEPAVRNGSGSGSGGWPRELDTEYECLGELGRGGMAVVYRARERALGRDVAIKVVRPRFHSDEESVARLAREARTVAQLEHPNIVSLHAVKRLDNGLALVMQLVPGRTLKAALARGAFAPAEAESVLRDITRALAYAHRCGVVHRDVKPENIFLDEITGRALLSDFGVARSIEENTELTATGTAIGTPTYMSPEQIDGGHLDGRSDLYSLGMVGWEMLTGQRPWAGESLYSVIYRQKHDPLPPVDAMRSDVPPRLQYLIEGLMHKNPDRRWTSAARFLTFLTTTEQVPGFKEWQNAARKRRKSGNYRTMAARGATPANVLSTVRFRRDDTPEGTPVDGSPDELQVIPVSDPAATQRVTPPAWRAPDVAPELPAEEERRRWPMYVGTLVFLAAAAGAAMYFRGPPPPTTIAVAPSPGLGDRSAVVIPVLPPADSLLVAGGTLHDSLATDSQAGVADTLLAAPPPPENVDSLRALATAELAGRSTRSPIPAPPPSTTPRDTPATRSARTTTALRDSAPSAPLVLVSFPADRGVIAAGGRHSCAVADDGVVRCWGNNERGQLGDGTFDPHTAPVPIAGDFAFAAVSAGVWHTCGVGRDGEVYCWGSNDAGQLGDGTTSPRSAPVRVSGSASYRVVRAGQSHTCGLSRNGNVLCWGSNALGQLGDGSRATRTTPVTVSLGASAGAVTVGRGHSCALTVEGVAYCWGQNDGGQLGDGTTTDRAAPAAVAGGQRFVSIAAGSSHTCAVSTAGTLYCWGRNTFGQIGSGGSPDGATYPQPVDVAGTFATVTAGQVHSCARARDGRAFCWGRNTYGQLGDGGMSDRARPVAVRGGTTFAALNASGAHTCGTTAGGDSFCWGYNIDGQLGAGDRENASAPARVNAPVR